MNEWKEVRLGDVCEISSSKRIFAREYSKEGVPFYRGKEIIEKQRGRIISEPLFITREHYNQIKMKYGVPQANELLLTSVGTLGIPYVVKDEEFYFKDGNLTWFRFFNGIDPFFLYYWFLSCYGKNQVNAKAIGTTQRALTIDCLTKFTLNVPPLSTQRAIASILSSFDDKIAINRKICANLEAQAQALFKHWFIDFTPFKDGKFVESELGMIPEGWKVGTYSDIIKETISGDWGKDKEEGNYSHNVACIRGCDFQDVKMGLRGKTPERYILEKNFQSKHFEDKDVLVEISGGTATVSTGRVCPVSQLLIDKYNGNIVCTNFCRLVRPNKGYSSYLYYSWKYMYDKKIMFGYENGTSGIKNFRMNDFITKELLILPELSALNEFESIIEHIHTQIQNYGSESAKLSSLRDTLLPKLMSGEIKI